MCVWCVGGVWVVWCVGGVWEQRARTRAGAVVLENENPTRVMVGKNRVAVLVVKKNRVAVLVVKKIGSPFWS